MKIRKEDIKLSRRKFHGGSPSGYVYGQITFRTKQQVELFAQMIEYYMETVYEPPCDNGLVSLVDSLAETFEKQTKKILK